MALRTTSASAGEMARAGAPRMTATSGSPRRTALPASGSNRSSQEVSARDDSETRKASISRPTRESNQTIAPTTLRL